MSLSAASRKKAFLSALWVCLAACGLTLLLLAAAYALRGVWPFGADNVAYVDTAQFYLPSYYDIWDVLHGASRDVNWFAGLAESGNVSVKALLSPVNLVFLMVPRDHVLEGLSLYLAAYMLLIAFISSLVIHLRFRTLAPVWQVILALCYTFSGYVLQYYANFNWLWIAAVFPLVPLSLERLLRDGRYLPYGLVYAYFLYQSVYFTYMATIYVLLFSFAYVVFLLPRGLRGDRLLRLGLTTAAAYGLTAYWWIGTSSSLAGTSRFQSNLDTGLLDGISTWNLPNTRHTILMLLGMAFALAVLIRALRRQRLLPPEDRARRAAAVRFFALLLGAMAVPMIFTNIDAAWHFGQYNFFPMRYGFMLQATLLAAAGLALQEESAAPEPRERLRAAGIAAAVVMAAALIVCEPKLSAYFREYGSCFLNTLGKKLYWTRYMPLLVGCGVLFTALYLLLLRGRRRGARILAAAVVLLQLGANAFGLIAPSDDHVSTHEYDPAYVEAADSLYEYFSGQDISPLSRVKNVDNSLNAGYPSIAGVSALSSVYASNSATRLGVFRELGYSVNYFRILDTGGTVFSDMLLGVDRVLSTLPLDDALYADTGVETDGVRIGEARYPGVVGLMYPEDALDGYLDLLSLPERLNAVYRAFTDSDGTLAYSPALSVASEGEGLPVFTLTVELPERSFLYLYTDRVLLNISANDRAIAVPSYQNTGNTVYPAVFNNNLLCLGLFDAGEVVLRFQSSADVASNPPELTALSAARIESFRDDALYDAQTGIAAGDESLTVTLNAPREGLRLFLPLAYRSGWQCTVNGEPVELRVALGTMMSVPLREGENTVSLTYRSGGFRRTSTAAVSLLFLALIAAWFALRSRLRLPADGLPRGVGSAVCALFYAVFAAVMLFVYAAPIVLLILRGSIVSF